MNPPLIPLLGHLLNVAGLMVVAAWYGHNPDWEPILALVALLGTYFGTGYALLLVMYQLPEPGAQVFNAEETKTVIGGALLNVPEYGREALPVTTLSTTGRSRDQHAAIAVVSMLRNLGLFYIDGNGLVSPVSERAHAFTSCIALSLKEGTHLFGDWSAVGHKNPQSQNLRAILGKAEGFRVTKLGKHATPTRNARSAIALIKAKHRDGDRFLLQMSHAWEPDGYYWFIGGVMDPGDKNIVECACRELLEELRLERPMIQSVVPLRTVDDFRISARIGALTSYEYTLCSVVLDPSRTRVKEIHRMEHDDEIPVSWTTGRRQNRWHTWEEILTSPGIRRNASCILKALKTIGPDAIQYSTPLNISDS
ncbi:MAG: NUDIX domain-containing protein [Planctomycetota bacterium]